MEKEIPISQKMELGSLKDLLRLVVSIMGRSNQSDIYTMGKRWKTCIFLDSYRWWLV